MSKQQILDHVWQYDFGGNDAVVQTYISYLRRKADAFDPPLIHTVPRIGYVMRLSTGPDRPRS
jgi:two-component system, OmpR family, response regulator